MCIQIKTIFRCSCPHQNTLLCPHHIYIRTTQQEVNNEEKYANNGYKLRLESALQAHRDWTPLRHDDELAAASSYSHPKWEYCTVYKARYQVQTAPATVTSDIKSASGKEKEKEKEKEASCPNWIQNQESFSKLVRGLCAECVDGHGVRRPSPVKGRFVEEIEVEVDVGNLKKENKTRPSTPTSVNVKGISQQTPLRKILSQAKQKLIRHSLGVQGNGDSRTSTPVPARGGTSPDQSLNSDAASIIGKDKGKGKELPDVFARLLLGTGSPKRQGGGNSGTGTGTPTPVKRPVSRQTKGAGRAGK